MGFGGSTQSMITIIKNNRKLLSNRKQRPKRSKAIQKVTYSDNDFSQSHTLEEIEATKQRIKVQKQKELFKVKIGILVVLIFVIISLCTLWTYIG